MLETWPEQWEQRGFVKGEQQGESHLLFRLLLLWVLKPSVLFLTQNNRITKVNNNRQTDQLRLGDV